MAFKVVDAEALDNDLKSIADAIRTKGGTSESLDFPNGFSVAIANIKTGDGAKEEQEKTLDVVENGDYDIFPDSGKVLSKATVNVKVPDKYEDLDADLTEQEELITTLQNALKGKAIGGGSADNGILPIGYTPVPSIKFTGEQAVDTGVICNQNTQIRAVFTAEEDKGMYIYGVANTDNTASVTAYRSSVGGRWRFGNQFIVLTTLPDEKRVWSVQVNKENIIRDGVTSTYSNVNDFTAEGTLVLGGGRLADGNIETSTRLIGKIVTFELYDEGEPVLSFIPCKNAESVCGFWDIVSEQFFTTIGDTPLQWSFI